MARLLVRSNPLLLTETPWREILQGNSGDLTAIAEQSRRICRTVFHLHTKTHHHHRPAHPVKQGSTHSRSRGY